MNFINRKLDDSLAETFFVLRIQKSKPELSNKAAYRKSEHLAVLRMHVVNNAR